MAQHRPALIHATAVALPVEGTWAGVLLRGRSGSGKSDLALRLIDDGARLIADDQCEVCASDGALTLGAPARLAGTLEVRGVGLVTVPTVAQAPLVLVADLVADGDVERLPAPQSTSLAGISVALVRLAPFQASAAAKLRLAALAAMRDASAACDRQALP